MLLQLTKRLAARAAVPRACSAVLQLNSVLGSFEENEEERE
jgi:hypothetical protein